MVRRVVPERRLEAAPWPPMAGDLFPAERAHTSRYGRRHRRASVSRPGAIVVAPPLSSFCLLRLLLPTPEDTRTAARYQTVFAATCPALNIGCGLVLGGGRCNAGYALSPAPPRCAAGARWGHRDGSGLPQ